MATTVDIEKNSEKSGIPPRERILTAAAELFYRHGIRAIGVEAIADAAGTNKMTLYRHFTSKDELVAECLRRLAKKADSIWDRLAADHPGDPRAQLHAWLTMAAGCIADPDDRGCALVNAAVELPEKDHPARRVVEELKSAQRERLVALCRTAALSQPELLADQLFLLFEGARVCTQSIGPEGPGCRFVRMGEALIASHSA
ncbi:MAG TPA: TetR/AcrR family transcriptional regulator [Xanthobacteraceae bacterium]|nr:TetR/AcrR family transcriptional regulator [Xanthobacteraceae bacterium]